MFPESFFIIKSQVECSFSMKRMKTPLRSTMTEERFRSLAILHIDKHIQEVDICSVVTDFARLKGRCLVLWNLLTAIPFLSVNTVPYW